MKKLLICLFLLFCFENQAHATLYSIRNLTLENVLLESQPLQSLSEDLPLHLIPTTSKNDLPLVFLISGDGGWTSFDQSLSEQLSDKGIPVIGLDAQKYFWKAKTAEETALAISKVVDHYMQLWAKKSYILIGFSFGASVAPFVASHFSAASKETLKGVFCLSPDKTADFEIHLTDMLSFNTTRKHNVLEELKKIKAFNPLCIFGSEEAISLRNAFIATGVKTIAIPGSHHYNDNYKNLAEIIIKNLNTK